jgi:hypothetical protein
VYDILAALLFFDFPLYTATSSTTESVITAEVKNTSDAATAAISSDELGYTISVSPSGEVVIHPAAFNSAHIAIKHKNFVWRIIQPSLKQI